MSRRNSKSNKQQSSRVEISIHKDSCGKDESLDVTGNDPGGDGGDGCDDIDEFDCMPDEEDLALVDDEMGEALMFLKGIETT